MITQRTTDEILHAMSPNGDVVAVDLSTDYIVPATKSNGAPLVVKGIISADGTVIVVDKKNSAAMGSNTVTMSLPAPDWSGIDGITKVYRTGTDATKIYLIIE